MPEIQSNAIRVLHNEHRIMQHLLDLLEGQFSLFEQTKQPDYDLIKEVVDYFLTYPDLCHHPKENLILRKLEMRDPEAAERVLNLKAQHEKGSELLRNFSRALIDILLEAEISREAFIDIAKQFIESERAHMSAEEEHFFPQALRCLSAEDWSEIDEKIDRFRDPLMALGSLRFGLLHEHISAGQHRQAS